MFDYYVPGIFYRKGLQFLLAEEDNIGRSIKVRKGLYTAKAKKNVWAKRIKVHKSL